MLGGIVGVPVGVSEGVGVKVGTAVGVSEGVGVKVGASDGVGVGVSDGVGVGVACGSMAMAPSSAVSRSETPAKVTSLACGGVAEKASGVCAVAPVATKVI